MKLEVYWIALASVAGPGVLAVLLRRTPVYWLPSALLLVYAATAFVIAVLLLMAPDMFLDKASIGNRLLHGFGIGLAFVFGFLLSMWAMFVAGCGVVAMIATASWRVRRRLPTRFGATWPPRNARGAQWGDPADDDVSRT